MPKNLTGGSGSKSKKNHVLEKVRKLEDIKKEGSDQYYGKVTSVLGNRRFKVRCKLNKNDDYSELTCTLQGKIPRSKRVFKDSYVLIIIPEYNDKNGFIVEIYDDIEINRLKQANYWDYIEIDQSHSEDNIITENEEKIDKTEDKIIKNKIDEDNEDIDIMNI